MKLIPKRWDVVLVGCWNVAILTPKGIATRLFQLEEGKQVRVDVPLDGLAPYRVHDDDKGLVVMPDSKRLIVALDRPTYDSLAASLTVASRALHSLPETPVQAVGFNLRFRSEDSDGLSDAVGLLNKDVDDRFSDAGFPITARSITRSVTFLNGTINTSLRLEGEVLALDMNFERTTADHDELLSWLTTSQTQIREMVQKTVDALNLEITEDDDDGNNEQE